MFMAKKDAPSPGYRTYHDGKVKILDNGIRVEFINSFGYAKIWFPKLIACKKFVFQADKYLDVTPRPKLVDQIESILNTIEV